MLPQLALRSFTNGKSRFQYRYKYRTFHLINMTVFHRLALLEEKKSTEQFSFFFSPFSQECRHMSKDRSSVRGMIFNQYSFNVS